MRYLNIAIDFLIGNKKLLIILLAIILGYIVFTNWGNYYNKEIKLLERQLAQKEEQFNQAIKEKQQLQDSSAYYEDKAIQADHVVVEIKHKADKLKKEKELALYKLHNISEKEINDFIDQRYINVAKENIDLSVDKNVGNEIVKELTEKDFLSKEIILEKDQNKTLTGQVDNLKTSLDFSKQALSKADSAIAARSKQLSLSQDINQMLKKDLQTAKKKAFWGKVKGVGVGVAVGVVVGVFAK